MQSWQHPPWLQRFLLSPCLLSSSHSKAPAGPSYLHHPPVPPPGERRGESTCIPRYPKEIQPPSQSCEKPGLGAQHIPCRATFPRRSSVPGSQKRGWAAAEHPSQGCPRKEGKQPHLPPAAPGTELWMKQWCSAPGSRLCCSL